MVALAAVLADVKQMMDEFGAIKNSGGSQDGEIEILQVADELRKLEEDFTNMMLKCDF